LKELVDQIIKKIRELKNSTYDFKKSYKTDMESIVSDLEVASKSCKLNLFGLKEKVISRLRNELEELFKEERGILIKRAIKEAIIDDYQFEDEVFPGLLSYLENELKNLYDLLDSLYYRISDQRRIFEDSLREIDKKIINNYGIVLFKPNETIDNEYKKSLQKRNSSDYEISRDKAARDIFKEWKEIENIVLKYNENKDFKNYDGKKEKPFSKDILKPLIDKAKDIFYDIKNADVFEKWSEFYSTKDERITKARELINKINYSIKVDLTLAEQIRRSPVLESGILVIPDKASTKREEFLEEIKKSENYNKNFKEIQSPYGYRILFIKELIKWPIGAVREVVDQENSLYSSKYDEFSTFHTRKDVNWIPLNEQELNKIKEAKSLIILGVLFDIFKPVHGGKLIFSKGEKTVEFTMDINKAAFELTNQPNIIDTLKNMIQNKREQLKDNNFLQEILNNIKKGKGNEIPNWDSKEIKNHILENYILKDTELKKELVRVKPIDEDLKNKLFKKAGDEKPKGGVYDKDGYYCKECGGLIGYTEEEALENLWKCVNSHEFWNPFD
ncbi:MAG: hypothetical protein ACPL1F_00585, partial [bacterium]